MKTILSTLLLLSLLTSGLRSEDPSQTASSSTASNESGAVTLSEREVKAILENTVLPRVTFSGTSLKRALSSLEEMINLKQADGVRIAIVLSGVDPTRAVNFSVRNLAADRIFDIIAQQTGTSWGIVGGVIEFAPVAPGGGSPSQSPPAADLSLGASMSDPFAAPAGPRGRGEAYLFYSAPPTAASIPGGFRQDFDTESYDQIDENSFRSPRVAPLSTFSIDVDTASYSNLRRMILQGRTPPADAIRIEELINYFPYDYPEPQPFADVPEKITPGSLPEFLEHPVAIETEVGPAPWNPQNRLLRIALKGFEIEWDQRPPANLVFLLDVSGSMNAENKLPLVKESLRLLIERLNGNDRVAIVVYAGASGLVLPSTTANNTETLLHALDNLQAGGSTNAGAGMDLAYQTAQEHFIEEGVNRVILCTDGDFNIGVTDKGSLVEKAEGYAEEGIFLTILGFGMGNYKDDMLEALTNAADGNYAYIDSPQEAKRLFLQAASGSMITIAKDVKIQVEFNPALVKAYRLIGYENRLLNAEDFNDDTKDAGELGAGQTVTALYEVALPDSDIKLPEVDDLKYQTSTVDTELPMNEDWAGEEIATVKLRYKWPKEDTSHRMEIPAILSPEIDFSAMGEDFRLTAALATWGMLLRGSEFTDDEDWSIVEEVAADQQSSPDASSLLTQWSELVEKSKGISERENSDDASSE